MGTPICPICGKEINGGKLDTCIGDIYALVSESRKPSNIGSVRSAILKVDRRYRWLCGHVGFNDHSEFIYSSSMLELLVKDAPRREFHRSAFDYVVSIMQSVRRVLGMVGFEFGFPTYNFFLGPVIELFGVLGFSEIEDKLRNRYMIMYRSGKSSDDRFYNRYLIEMEGL